MTRATSGEDRDRGQYAWAEIHKYEAMYGRNFISPGGPATALEFAGMLSLQAGERVLDAGCGLGGGAFLMARQYAVRVHAIDVSRNMVEIARRRLGEENVEDLVTVEHGDCCEIADEAGFDAIYSRDVFLHVEGKARLFRRLFGALRPGGRMLVTDYCCGPQPWSAEFSSSVEHRGYHLCTVSEYARLLSDAGFVAVCAEDRTGQFIDIHTRELCALDGSALDDEEVADIGRSWRAKIDRARRGELHWGLFTARKPA